MPITLIKETSDNRSCSFSVTQWRSYTLTLHVETDDQTIGPRAVALALGLKPGDTYRFPLTSAATEADPASYLQSIEVQTQEEGLHHTVTLAYGPYDATTEGGAQGADVANWIMAPWEAPPTIHWSGTSEDFACTHDRAGNPILNTAGDPFDPAIQIPVSTPTVSITQVVKAFDPTWISVFKDTVNADVWMGFPAESVLCEEITADRSYDGDWGWLWTVTYTFSFRPTILADDGVTVIDAGWSLKVLNAGMRQLKGGVKSAVIIDGATVSTPVPLTDKGQYDPTADPFYLSFNVRRTSDFNALNLPDDLFTVNTP